MHSATSLVLLTACDAAQIRGATLEGKAPFVTKNWGELTFEGGLIIFGILGYMFCTMNSQVSGGEENDGWREVTVVVSQCNLHQCNGSKIEGSSCCYSTENSRHIPTDKMDMFSDGKILTNQVT